MILKTKQAAEYIGYCPRQLRLLAKGGAISYSRPSRNRMLFRTEDLDEFILECRRERYTTVSEAIKRGGHK